jgi:glycosyltransferase involved in cell wall biosynthesis
MSKPSVLVFIDWYAPGYKAGGPVRSMVNMVEQLRHRFAFFIVTGDTDYTEHTAYPGVVPDQWTTLPGGEQVWYASGSGRTLTKWRGLLRERKWDVVYVNGLYSWWYSILPLLLLGPASVRVVAPRGMLAHGMLAYQGTKKRLFLGAMRLAGAYRNVRFHATNDEEAKDTQRWLGASNNVRIVPNLSGGGKGHANAAISKRSGSLKLISLARIAAEKNTLFAIERLAGLPGEVNYDLYGPVYEEAYWRRCQQAIARLPTSVKVRHMGPLPPERVPEVLAGYHALFMPSQGENFGHSMAEALAHGLPLLISDRTPWRGLLAAHAGWDLSLQQPDAFAESLRLLVDMDQAQHAHWRAGAAAFSTRYLAQADTIERTAALLTP